MRSTKLTNGATISQSLEAGRSIKKQFDQQKLPKLLKAIGCTFSDVVNNCEVENGRSIFRLASIGSGRLNFFWIRLCRVNLNDEERYLKIFEYSQPLVCLLTNWENIWNGAEGLWRDFDGGNGCNRYWVCGTQSVGWHGARQVLNCVMCGIFKSRINASTFHSGITGVHEKVD